MEVVDVLRSRSAHDINTFVAMCSALAAHVRLGMLEHTEVGKLAARVDRQQLDDVLCRGIRATSWEDVEALGRGAGHEVLGGEAGQTSGDADAGDAGARDADARAAEARDAEARDADDDVHHAAKRRRVEMSAPPLPSSAPSQRHVPDLDVPLGVRMNAVTVCPTDASPISMLLASVPDASPPKHASSTSPISPILGLSPLRAYVAGAPVSATEMLTRIGNM